LFITKEEKLQNEILHLPKALQYYTFCNKALNEVFKIEKEKMGPSNKEPLH